MIVSPITRSMNSTRVQSISKPVPVNRRISKNFGGDSVGCQKITKDKSSKSRVQTPDAGLIIAITTAPRREGQNPRLSITAAPRREGQNPRSLQHQDARVETRVSASLQHQDVRVKTGVSVLLQHQCASCLLYTSPSPRDS